MGLIKNIILGFTLTILVLLFAPGLPPHVNFEVISLEPPLPLSGKLSHNDILDKAEKVKLDRDIVGPESIAIRGDELYTGVVGGDLVKIKDGRVSTVTRFGNDCEGPWDIKCGRICGLRFGPNGKLYAADASYGIFEVDVDTGASKQLVRLDEKIDGSFPMFPDDLDVAKNGKVYWSDASRIADMNTLVLEVLAGPTGRLIEYDPKTKKNTVLISGLSFGNGVQLSSKEDFVLISDSCAGRVIRYYLTGAKKSQTDIFIDNLPGLPDNIRPNQKKDGFYITLAMPRTSEKKEIQELLGHYPLVRKLISRIYSIISSTLRTVQKIFPNPVFGEFIFYIERLGPLGDLSKLPFKTIVVETDGNGNILGSLQNDKGPVTGLSEVSVGKECVYLGSPTHKLYRLKKSYLS